MRALRIECLGADGGTPYKLSTVLRTELNLRIENNHRRIENTMIRDGNKTELSLCIENYGD